MADDVLTDGRIPLSRPAWTKADSARRRAEVDAYNKRRRQDGGGAA